MMTAAAKHLSGKVDAASHQSGRKHLLKFAV